MGVTDLIAAIVGDDLPVRITAYDGSELGPADAPLKMRIATPDAIHRIVSARGQELGFARAIVAGEIELEGDIFELFRVSDRVAKPTLDRSLLRPAAEVLGLRSLRDVGRLRPLPPPPEEISLTGRLHSRTRDAAAIASHYGVSNEFYRMLLGPSLTYSCAVYEAEGQSLETAQFNKHDLMCRKLALQPGMRLLDVGCGWGSMVIHAAKHFGAQAVGVTISQDQADLARKRVAEAGLGDQISIRLQDYRDVVDGPFDAISSVGMAEHVGPESELSLYFEHISHLLAPTGRFVNHAISRSPHHVPGGKGSFIQRYVFPDGELHEVGRSVSLMQEVGLEVRHLETLREHYARTLRSWLENLERNWDDAVAEIGQGRALVWKLYMAGAAVAFERGVIGVHQTLAVHEGQPPGRLPLRPDW